MWLDHRIQATGKGGRDVGIRRIRHRHGSRTRCELTDPLIQKQDGSHGRRVDGGRRVRTGGLSWLRGRASGGWLRSIRLGEAEDANERQGQHEDQYCGDQFRADARPKLPLG